jgi:uncharacterized delta-60 repeat protein
MQGKRARLGSAIVVLALVIAACAAQAADRSDRTFGGDGFVKTPVPKAVDFGPVAPNIWELVPHGRGSVGVLADLTSRQDVFGLVRYRRDGVLGRAFGDEGFTRPLSLNVAAQAQAAAADRHGRIVVVGFTHRFRRIPLLVRYRPNGSLDRSFGTGGVVNPRRLPHGGGAVHDVVIEPGGRILVAGTIGEKGIGENGTRSGGFVAAYRQDGSVDRSFGRAGRVRFDLPRPEGDYSGLKQLRILSDGRILVSGFEDGKLFLARLLPSGRLDRSFGGGDGTVAVFNGDHGSGCSANCWSASSFAIRPDGKIVALSAEFPDAPAIYRFNPDGTLDRGFGDGGLVKIHRKGVWLQAFDLDLQRGRIVVSGFDQAKHGKAKLSFCVLRFRGDGRVDRGFGHNGAVIRSRNEFSGAYALLPQPQRRLLVGGGGQDRAEGARWSRSVLLLTRILPG